jgi:hypothetical protein
MQIPTRYRAKCELCPNEILDTRADGVCQYGEGWLENRSNGGAHGVRLPKRHNRWAHRQCVDKASKGHTGQGGLF